MNTNIEELSLSDADFKKECKRSDEFANLQQKRSGHSPFTEQEELFNVSTKNWVEIFGSSQ